MNVLSYEDWKKLKMMAHVLIAQGCNNTEEGSYSWEYEELAVMFGTSKKFIIENVEDLVEMINAFAAVAAVEWDIDGLTIDFYLNYCGLGDEDEN